MIFRVSEGECFQMFTIPLVVTAEDLFLLPCIQGLGICSNSM
jgi:hypothetical protein